MNQQSHRETQQVIERIDSKEYQSHLFRSMLESQIAEAMNHGVSAADVQALLAELAERV